MQNRLAVIFAAAAVAVLSCSPGSLNKAVREHIAASWQNTLRLNTEDTPDSLIGLPRPYTVPCEDGMFNELYYWDTFFTNEGLIADSRPEMARDNTLDILYLINKYGFMPNGNRLWYLSRSQPPFAAAMVERVFEATADTSFLREAYPVLQKEYSFWQEKRLTPTGLNRYGGEADEKLIQEFIGTAGKRLGTDFRSMGWSPEELSRFGEHCVAECESGWDFNPRFNRRCEDYCPVDLNAILYGAERSMARFAEILENGEQELWRSRAGLRRERILRYMYRDGYFFDYDYVNGELSGVVSAAPFALLFFGVLDDEKAASLRSILPRLEYPHGLAVCEDAPYEYSYQWSFPNAWPPVMYMAVMGLERYGFREDARRIASNWMKAAEKLYAKTGKLWEKTDCTTGSVPRGSEYGTPSMMGWTAGTYVCFDEYLKNE